MDYKLERNLLTKLFSSLDPDYEFLDVIKTDYFAYSIHVDLYQAYIECIESFQSYDRLMINQIIRNKSGRKQIELIEYLDSCRCRKIVRRPCYFFKGSSWNQLIIVYGLCVCRDIKGMIENLSAFPGKIKIGVICEI